MSQIARIRDTAPERRLQAERLLGPVALREAQTLRFRVFSDELKAKLKSAEHGLDEDGYTAETWTAFQPGELVMFVDGRPQSSRTIDIPEDVRRSNQANLACV